MTKQGEPVIQMTHTYSVSVMCGAQDHTCACMHTHTAVINLRVNKINNVPTLIETYNLVLGQTRCQQKRSKNIPLAQSGSWTGDRDGAREEGRQLAGCSVIQRVLMVHEEGNGQAQETLRRKTGRMTRCGEVQMEDSWPRANRSPQRVHTGCNQWRCLCRATTSTLRYCLLACWSSAC